MLAQVKITNWDIKECSFTDELSLSIGDYVIILVDNVLEYGRIINFLDSDKKQGLVKRIVTDNDKNKLVDEQENKSAFEICKQKIEKFHLPMKLINANYSFDKTKITFTFISDGRVDFRNLLKDLNVVFKIIVRLYQIGVRDEAKLIGDCGHCGRELCCKSFMNSFSSITSDMVETQQISHRGSERTSGMCGRLLCCLGFENENYQNLLSKLPKVGKKIKVGNEKLEIVGINTLKGTVNVKTLTNKNNGSSIMEVDPKTNKPC